MEAIASFEKLICELHQPHTLNSSQRISLPKKAHRANSVLIIVLRLPFDNEADSMALVQDAFELGNSVGAGSLEGDLVGNANDLHGPWVAGYFAVGNRHHVI